MDLLKDNEYTGLYFYPDASLIPLCLRNIFQVSRFINFGLKIHRQIYVNRWKNMNLGGRGESVELDHTM